MTLASNRLPVTITSAGHGRRLITVPSVVPAKSLAADVEQNLRKLVGAKHRVLLLDYDGTLGDDRTDEDAFVALSADAITFRVGRGPALPS